MRYIERKVKLPDWLWGWLEEVARDNNQSIDDTIAWLLTQTYNIYERTALIKLMRLKEKCRNEEVVSHE